MARPVFPTAVLPMKTMFWTFRMKSRAAKVRICRCETPVWRLKGNDSSGV